MNLEELLSCLYRSRADIARKLDADSRKELTAHIRNALKTNTVSKPFFTFCGSTLSEFGGVSCDRYFPGDDLPESDVEIYANEIIEALEPNEIEESGDEDQ